MSLYRPDDFRAASPWGPVPVAPGGWTWERLMAEALAYARLGAAKGEVPVGAVLADDEGKILAAAHNETESLRDPTAHAEVLVLRRASAVVGNHRLGGCVLVVTLEPCMMCVGAIREARVSGLVYGAEDSRAGAVCSRLNGWEALPGPSPWYMGGVASAESAGLLREFFQQRRP